MILFIVDKLLFVVNNKENLNFGLKSLGDHHTTMTTMEQQNNLWRLGKYWLNLTHPDCRWCDKHVYKH